VLTVMAYKKGEFKKHNIDIDNDVEEDRLVYSNECNKWEGGGLRNNYKTKQNRMLENYVCNDRIKNDEVANILLSLNRKNTLDNSCNDKEDNNSEGENEGDINYQFGANIKMSAGGLGKGNVSVAEECGVDNCEGELEENSKDTFHINDHECNVSTDTEGNIGIIFQLEG
jgi:hypothetical protein